MNKMFLMVIVALIGTGIIAGIIIESDPEPPTSGDAALDAELSEVVEKVEQTESDIEDTGIRFENFFVHTAPGEYSHIEVRGSGYEPGQKVIIYHRRTGTETWEPGFEVFADADGDISTGIKIYSFGSYDILAGAGEDTIVVE